MINGGAHEIRLCETNASDLKLRWSRTLEGKGFQELSRMRCTWCSEDRDDTSGDHVVPRSIGGTLEYVVPSCKSCQTKLSQIEQIASRKSILAIHALTSGVAPRHRNRPDSGVLQPSYLLLKHPLGGYGEAVFRAGGRMEALSHCEIKVVPGEEIEGRVRGASWEESERLFAKFREALSRPRGPDGLVCELNVSVDVAPEISADPDFWSRAVLLPNGNLLIRARDPEEATRFISAFTNFVVLGNPRDPKRWTSTTVDANTKHYSKLVYKPQAIRRLAAKIAYGTEKLVSGTMLDADLDRALRAYVLGTPHPGAEPVSEAPSSLQIATGVVSHHEVILRPPFDPSAAIVRLYGHSYHVELGEATQKVSPIVVLCKIDGSGMRVANHEESEQAIAESAVLRFRQPWHKKNHGLDALDQDSSSTED